MRSEHTLSKRGSDRMGGVYGLTRQARFRSPPHALAPPREAAYGHHPKPGSAPPASTRLHITASHREPAPAETIPQGVSFDL